MPSCCYQCLPLMVILGKRSLPAAEHLHPAWSVYFGPLSQQRVHRCRAALWIQICVCLFGPHEHNPVAAVSAPCMLLCSC